MWTWVWPGAACCLLLVVANNEWSTLWAIDPMRLRGFSPLCSIWLVVTHVADGLHGLMYLTWAWHVLGPLLRTSTTTSERFWNLPWCIISMYVSPPQHNTTVHHTSDHAPQHKPTTPLLQAHYCHSNKHSSTTLGHADDAGHVVNSHLL